MKRHFSITFLTALTALFCLGVTTPANGQSAPRPRHADIIGGGFNAGAIVFGGIAIVSAIVAGVVIVGVNHDQHVLKGCVASGPNGLQLQTSDSATYLLKGDASAIKAGNIVKLHGWQERKPKGNKGDGVFVVRELKKDYGPCHVTAVPAADGTS